MHNNFGVATTILNAALTRACDQRPGYKQWVAEVVKNEAPGRAVEELLFWEFILPRQTGKTTAILELAMPGDVVLCGNVTMAKDLERRLSEDETKTGIAVFSVNDFHWFVKEIRQERSFYSNTFFFDECDYALNEAKRIFDALYIGQKELPNFFSMKTGY